MQGQHTQAPFSNDTQPTVYGSPSISNFHSGGDIFAASCIALKKLCAVEIQPDILVNSSITLPPTARQLLSEIAAQMTHYNRLLLCCIKWEFNANEDIDQPWAFYLGQEGQDFSNLVRRYNEETGDQMTTELASSRFARIKVCIKGSFAGKHTDFG